MEMTLDVKIGDEPIKRGFEGQEAIESFFRKSWNDFSSSTAKPLKSTQK